MSSSSLAPYRGFLVVSIISSSPEPGKKYDIRVVIKSLSSVLLTFPLLHLEEAAGDDGSAHH